MICTPVLALEAAAFGTVLALFAMERRARLRAERLLIASLEGRS